jgi:hypothetical protein
LASDRFAPVSLVPARFPPERSAPERLGGGVITIAFTYLFGLESTVVHTLMVAALAVVLSLSLFSIAALDHPFRGDVRIHPDALEQDLERFHESKLSDL